MKNNPKLLLYICAALLAFLLWNKWQIANLPPAPPQAATTPAAVAPDNTAGADVPQATAGSDIPAANAENGATVRVKTDVFDLHIATKGGTIVHADLLKYAANKNSNQPLALLHPDNPARFLLQSGLTSGSGDKAPTHHSEFTASAGEYTLADGQDSLTVPLTWQEDGITVSKTYTFKRGAYDFTLEQKVQNDSGKTWTGNAYQQWVFGQPLPSGGMGQVGTYTGGAVSYDDDPYEKIKLGTKFDTKTENGWVAMLQHYFVGAIIPPQGQAQTFYTSTNATSGDHFIGVTGGAQQIAAGQSAAFTGTIYIGPKIQRDLKTVAPNLDKTVDYGFLFMIGQPMYYVLHFIHSIVGNWGWALILMTLLIKIIFFTPSAWAYKSMAKMRRLGPEMQRIKEQYGDDRQGASMAMMKLYKDEKVNPASGCLPMLLQIPFFIAFYWVLIESVELRHAPWIGWIHDLSAMDPYFILPIINAALMFLQQKLNPPPPDPTQAKVMMMLPLIFGFMFMWFPSGLVLYWTVSNAFGIVQQYVMNKRYGDRNHPAPDDARYKKHGKKHQKA
ncbi:membrane protein insertase YidC [uncultured Cardiobacterium sp.]|uniref:membrane protein insertase YidC n=1 Tax=uncultured Cardiobacterium sp. TaxID=417619 RepID=UPI002629AACC|nr:membrane protein insertase YidC [uncultured Cardiobacterium sp.]